MGAIIQTSNLYAGYGASHIIFGIDFEAKKEDITVIVGPNGSGKSTLLKSIFGLCSVYSGEITYAGEDITGLAPHAIARKKIAFLPQTNNVFADLTIRENLTMAGYTLDSKIQAERVPEMFETFPILKEYEKQKAGILSGGQRQMLAMSMALIRRPQLMLFDEPTASLSPKLADEVLEKIKEMRDEFGIAIILVEQNTRRALDVGDHVYLVAGGKRVFEGKPDQLLAQPDLGRMYLGLNQTP
ncbi:MAG: ABC transporter ATP-binding protein [Nitrosopumilus sp. H8]|nr:MAG: ABC transporter ATP-binding protein [Nitrosopumilus sp. H13]RNJ78372.1 MAG: ABC transporter ATP-binding protein [Nitrosopumilus sp. H8]